MLHGNHVVVGDGFGFIHVLRAEDGALAGRVQVDSSAVQSLVSLPSGVLVQTAGGTVALVKL